MNELIAFAEPTHIEDYYGFIVFVAIAFLLVMWGGFYFFDRFKKRDDVRREKFIDRVQNDD